MTKRYFISYISPYAKFDKNKEEKKMTPTEQTPSECKHYDCEYCAHPDHYCKGHLQNICDLEHELVENCSDYEPKEKKDDSRTDYPSNN